MSSKPSSCRCRVCQAGEGLAPRHQQVVDHVRDHGWHAAAVKTEETVPGWAYSIGLWHTLSRAEVCVFGLPDQTGMRIVNTAGELLRSDGTLFADENSGDILVGYEVAVRRVDPSWDEDLFGQAVGFYRGRTPTFLQLVWPDRDGRFPWDEGVDAGCRESQPMLWLPWSEHPRGVWTELRLEAEWSFGDVCPDEQVFTMKRIMEGESRVVGVCRDHDGVWQFLDGGRIEMEDITHVHLRHLVDRNPQVARFADLRPGEQAWEQPDGTWQRSAVPGPDSGDG